MSHCQSIKVSLNLAITLESYWDAIDLWRGILGILSLRAVYKGMLREDSYILGHMVFPKVILSQSIMIQDREKLTTKGD